MQPILSRTGAEFRAVDANLRVAMSCYRRATSAGEARVSSNLSLTCSGMDFAVYNSAMLLESLAHGGMTLERQIAIAAAYFETRELGWSFWLCEEQLPPDVRRKADRIFAAQGLQRIASPPGMLTECLRPPRRSQPRLQCRAIEDETDRLAFCEVASTVFALPMSVTRTVYGASSIWSGPMTPYIAYCGNQVVSIVCTVVSADALGVYSLATMPSFRGRGYAEALLRFAVTETTRRHPGRDLVLQATQSGYDLYRKLGFRAVARFSVYLRDQLRG